MVARARNSTFLSSNFQGLPRSGYRSRSRSPSDGGDGNRMVESVDGGAPAVPIVGVGVVCSARGQLSAGRIVTRAARGRVGNAPSVRRVGGHGWPARVGTRLAPRGPPNRAA